MWTRWVWVVVAVTVELTPELKWSFSKWDAVEVRNSDCCSQKYKVQMNLHIISILNRKPYCKLLLVLRDFSTFWGRAEGRALLKRGSNRAWNFITKQNIDNVEGKSVTMGGVCLHHFSVRSFQRHCNNVEGGFQQCCQLCRQNINLW